MVDYINCPKTGEPIDCSTELLNLLAVICGDGGHWVQEFGVRAALERARNQHYQMREMRETLRQDPDRLHKLIDQSED